VEGPATLREERIPWSKADLTHFWMDAVYGISEGEWIEFYPDVPGTAEPSSPRRPMGPGRVVPMKKRG